MRPDQNPPSNPPPADDAVWAFLANATPYRIEHVPFSVGYDYRVLDADGRLFLFVDGKLLSPPRRLVVQDADGREVLKLRDRFLAVRARMEITREGQLVAAVRRRFWNFSWCQHTVLFPDKPDLWETSRHGQASECVSHAGQPMLYFEHLRSPDQILTAHLSPTADPALHLAIVIAIIESQRAAQSNDL